MNTQASSQVDFPAIRLGLAMWSQNHWQHTVYGHNDPNQRLARYAEIFNTVEGNTTFYATPSIQQAQIWRNAVNDNFVLPLNCPNSLLTN